MKLITHQNVKTLYSMDQFRLTCCILEKFIILLVVLHLKNFFDTVSFFWFVKTVFLVLKYHSYFNCYMSFCYFLAFKYINCIFLFHFSKLVSLFMLISNIHCKIYITLMHYRKFVIFVCLDNNLILFETKLVLFI